MYRPTSSELVLVLILIVCLMATFTMDDPESLFSNVVAGLLGYLTREAVDGSTHKESQ